MSSMLGLSSSWSSLFSGDKAVDWAGGENGWLASLLDILSQVLWVVLAITAAAGAVYAVFVGIKMARADSAEAREESKKRFINVIVSIVVVVVLIITFNVFVPMIISAVADYSGDDNYVSESISTLVNTIKCVARV